MKKQYKTQEQLERTIEEALFDYQHTQDPRARDEYHLIIQTAAQDYYTVTGDWYHRPIGNKSRKENNV